MTQPNVLLICTDQQRYDSLGCYGNAHAKTPNIDRLAREGVTFDRCYTPSPVCAPARASLLTGRYPHAHGLWANGVALPEHERLVTRDLADAGYDGAMAGKMHLAACFQGRTEPRRDDGLRRYWWAHDPSHGSAENAYHQWLAERHPAIHARAMAQGTGRQAHREVLWDTMPSEAHYSRFVGDRTIEFLREERSADQPFFMWANFFDPHHPFVAPQEYLDRFDPADLPMPIGAESLEGKPPIYRDASRNSYAGAARGFAEHTPEEIRAIVHAYYAMVALIDDEVGRILAALEETGRARDTLVIFTSDHGEMLGDHGMLLKGPMMFEGAVRVPLIMRWPGVLPAGERRPDLVQWHDLGPTILETAGLPPAPRAQTQSLLPLARGDAGAPARGWAICEYRNSGHPYDPAVHTTMLRRDDHKLVVHHGTPASARARTGELYDLARDPQERCNLWDSPEHARLRLELQEFLLDALVATEDRTQTRDAYW
jgi:arylsulfatase A-like enzyme